jgi:hypothetical protein
MERAEGEGLVDFKDMATEHLFESIQDDANWDNLRLIDAIFGKLELFTKDQLSLLEDIWAGNDSKLSRLENPQDEKKDKIAELELEIEGLKLDVSRSARKIKEIKRQAKHLERAKFRQIKK